MEKSIMSIKNDKDLLDAVLNTKLILDTFSEFLEIEDLIYLKRTSKFYARHLGLDGKITNLLEIKQREILFNYTHFISKVHKFEELFDRVDPMLKNTYLEKYQKSTLKNPETFLHYLFNHLIMKSYSGILELQKLGVKHGDIITFEGSEYLFLTGDVMFYLKTHVDRIMYDIDLKHFTPNTFHCRCNRRCFWKIKMFNYQQQLLQNYDPEKKSSKIVIKFKYGAEFVYIVKRYCSNELSDLFHEPLLYIVWYDSESQTIFITGKKEITPQPRRNIMGKRASLVN